VLAEIQAQYAIDLDPGGKLILLDGK
jgi:hypothetical protein